jgi:mannosyltransferase OCH1-like enzyme/SAM-dependent methyltransferase
MISFVIRVRDEAATLRASITSLFDIAVPIEIVVVLHRCTDDSKAIALGCQDAAPGRHNVRIVEHDVPVSRAGLETFITPSTSPHSLVSYNDFAFGLASHPWKFKWDGDFIATRAFVDWINGRAWTKTAPPTVIHVSQRMPGSPDAIHKEPYLYNCLTGFAKSSFWEVPIFPNDFLRVDMPDKAAFIRASDPASVKPYWREPPWFAKEDQATTEQTAEAAELRRLYAMAVQLAGPEPIGCARYCNGAALPYLARCQDPQQADARVDLHRLYEAHATAAPEDWADAQKFENDYWGLDWTPLWDEELKKQAVYHRLMGIHRDDFGTAEILDVGCGPISLLQRTKHGPSRGVDPIRVNEATKARYRAANVELLSIPAEEMPVDKKFDEVWMYNCLQHTRDPHEILRRITAVSKPGTSVRIFEWLDMGVSPGHPQNLTEALFKEHFAGAGWTRPTWNVATVNDDGAYGKCIAIHAVRQADKNDRAPATKYFLELGSANWDTLHEKLGADASWRGVTLDARADLLDRLPKRDNVEKIHAVVSTGDGGPTTVPFYYVPAEIVTGRGFPDWLHGCGSAHRDHAILSLFSDKAVVRRDIPAIGLPALLARLPGLDVVKTDLEGDDFAVVMELLDLGARPLTLEFEDVHMTAAQRSTLLARLAATGYSKPERSGDSLIAKRTETVHVNGTNGAAVRPSATAKPIPKIIHHIWIGSPFPTEFHEFRQGWVRHHPDWTFLFWHGDEAVEDPLVAQVLKSERFSPVVKSDILRLYALATMGGLYVDTDFECLKPFGELLSTGGFHCGGEAEGVLSSGLMACPANDAFVRSYLDAALQRLQRVSPNLINRRPDLVTGPRLLTELGMTAPITRHARTLFYPVRGTERHRLSEAPPPEAYARHHWAGGSSKGWLGAQRAVINEADEARVVSAIERVLSS